MSRLQIACLLVCLHIGQVSGITIWSDDNDKNVSATAAVEGDFDDSSNDEEVDEAFINKLEHVVDEDMELKFFEKSLDHAREQAHKLARLPQTCMSGLEKLDATHTKNCRDPWSKTKQCSMPYGNPGYRIDNIVLTNAFQTASHDGYSSFVAAFFPDSIGAKYQKMTKKREDYDALLSILKSPDFESFEKPAASELVLHLHAGPMLQECHSDFWNGYACKDDIRLNRYLRSRYHFEQVIERVKRMDGIKSITVLSGHSAEQSETLAEESLTYIEDVLALFREKTQLIVESRTNHNADCDFVYMANARYFLGTGSFYDNMIRNLIQGRGGVSI